VHPDGPLSSSCRARLPVYFKRSTNTDTRFRRCAAGARCSRVKRNRVSGCPRTQEQRATHRPVPGTAALKTGSATVEPFYGPLRASASRKEFNRFSTAIGVRCHFDGTGNPQGCAWKIRFTGKAIRLGPHPRRRPRAPGRPQVQWPPARAGQRARKTQIHPPALAEIQPAFSLRADETIDKLAKRRWSECLLESHPRPPHPGGEDDSAFRGREDGRMVNWIGATGSTSARPLPARRCGRRALPRGELSLLATPRHYGVCPLDVPNNGHTNCACLASTRLWLPFWLR